MPNSRTARCRIRPAACWRAWRAASPIARCAIAAPIGGSLAHADPAADWPTTLSALGARVHLAGPGGRRELAVEDFLHGAFQTALAPGEIIAGVFVPRLSPSARWGYRKSCRKAGEFAEAMCAVLLDSARNVCRLAIGATEGKPIVLTAADAFVADPDLIDPYLAQAGLAADPATLDLHRGGDPGGHRSDGHVGTPRMKPVRLEVNGRPIAADIEPRQHLADFVREEMLLTGTHLGCEHGVCGACTVLIDGAPARSCIAFPVALDGASITTIEGLADDAVIGAAARGVQRRARPAMRLLYAGHADHGARHRAAPARRQRRGHPPRARRQSLPLHRLCRHHPRGAAGGGRADRTGGGDHAGHDGAGAFLCLAAGAAGRAVIGGEGAGADTAR